MATQFVFCYFWYEMFFVNDQVYLNVQSSWKHIMWRDGLQQSITVSNQQCFWAKLNRFIFHLCLVGFPNNSNALDLKG